MKKIISAVILVATTTVTAAPAPLAADAPMIIDDWCSLEFDHRGYQVCFVTTADNQTVRYWQKDGQAFWAYPERD